MRTLMNFLSGLRFRILNPLMAILFALAAVIGTAGQADAQITFSDPNLEAAIREALDKAEGPITDADLGGLTELDASERDIRDLAGMEHCVNLEWLNLYGNQISDVSPLSGLSNLELLVLWDNQISDVGPLSGLSNLELLDLWDNQISDVSSLSGLSNLELLGLEDNQISDIKPLTNLIDLRILYLDSNQIQDISPLARLTMIGEVEEWRRMIGEVEVWRSFSRKKGEVEEWRGWFEERDGVEVHLGLSNNQISDTQPLVDNTGIGKGDGVDLSGNPLSGESSNTLIPMLEGRGVMVLARQTTVSILGSTEQTIPQTYVLSQNVPNPFNPLTTIAYNLPEASNVTLTIYTITGQKVAVLVDAHQQAGHHRILFDGSGFGTGVYLYHLEAGSFVETRRMVLLK